MKRIFIITLILAIFISCSGVWAEDTALNETMTTDDGILLSVEEDPSIGQTNDEAVSEPDGTFTQLQQLIYNTAGDTLVLDRDYYYDEGFDKNGININKDMMIDGNGHTLNGMSQSRIIHLYSEQKNDHYAVLKNINFKNGYSTNDGGAIYSEDNLIGGFTSGTYSWNLALENCQFSNNQASSGGAIFADGLTIIGCSFTGNSASGSGGAIRGDAQCRQCTFSNNRAADGGAISANGATLINCVFTGNSATESDGGAINSYYDGIYAESCTFNSNNAAAKGGAIYSHMENTQIKKSNFNNNKARSGGAIYFVCFSYSSYGSSSSFNKYSQIVEDSTFTANTATSAGGAVYSENPSGNTHSAKLVRCTLSGNKAPTGNDVRGASTENCIFKTTSSSSSQNMKLVLKTVKVKRSAKKLVLKATLKVNGKAVKGKKITFKFNGKKYTSKTNKKGIAKVTIKKNVLKKLKVGKKVKYQASFGKLTVKKTAKVLK
ncbi:MAG: hypothetical protein Q4Q18_05185 [Methanobrevibacter sp.]|nr:hypothetical protein [Methanobrevibacter sp.]